MAGFAKDGYYSFERLDGGYDGLVRVSEDGSRFERVTDAQWVGDQDLARHFVNPGSTFLEPVDSELAQQLAERYGLVTPSASRRF